MQAPFAIAAGPAEDPLAMRDAIRFYFGFSVAVSNCASSEAAIARVAASANEIAVVAAEVEGRWWDGLVGGEAPKIFAKLPFIHLPDRPAGLPAYVVGPPLQAVGAPDVRVLAVVAEEEGLERGVRSHAGQITGRSGDDFLIELPVATTPDDFCKEHGGRLGNVRDLGGFAQPIRYLSDRTA
jgi:hypothetical protein